MMRRRRYLSVPLFYLQDIPARIFALLFGCIWGCGVKACHTALPEIVSAFGQLFYGICHCRIYAAGAAVLLL